MNNILMIAIGGAIGSVSRYGCQKWIYQMYPHPFPFGTLAVNIVGSSIVGLIWGLAEKGSIGKPGWTLFLITGFCGGFTTFSAFSLETLSLLRNGAVSSALFYIFLSVGVGLIAVWGGYSLAKIL
jgi:CrcB protein